MNRRFWKNKNVLVTGNTGFLGSNLTKMLIICGANVVGVDIRAAKNRKSLLSREDYKRITSLRGNVCNYSLMKDIVTSHKIEVVFHLAAQAIVGKCWKNPLRAFSSNIRGTWVTLEACRHVPTIKAVIVASSDKAYGSSKKLPYVENLVLQGRYPYDVSKSCADLIAQAYHQSYGLPVAVTRCGNIYGPGDFNFSRIVPDLVRSLIKNKPLLIRSDGKFTRDYIYVDDIVNAYLMLGEKIEMLKLYGEAFNFSSEKPVSVLELVKTIFEITRKKPNYKILGIAKYEIKDQYLSAEKAKRILGWHCRYSLRQGLKKTISWYKNSIISK